jgi:hypothetical protein
MYDDLLRDDVEADDAKKVRPFWEDEQDEEEDDGGGGEEAQLKEEAADVVQCARRVGPRGDLQASGGEGVVGPGQAGGGQEGGGRHRGVDQAVR